MNNAVTHSARNDIELGKNGSYSMSRDVLKHNIWDTRYFTDDTISDFTYFTQPESASWRIGVKSINETNMVSTGQLPTSQTFLVKRIGVALISPIQAATTNTHDIVQAYYNIMQSSVFSLRIAGHTFDYQIHGRQFLPSVAVSGDLATNTPVRVGDVVASGWSSLDNTPLFIGNQISFNVFQKLANPDTSVQTILKASATVLNDQYCSMQVTLQGTLTRGK